MSEQSALAAAGFQMPADPEAAQLDERRRRLALEQAVALSRESIAAGNDPDAARQSAVENAHAFFDFLSGKSAQPKE